MSNSIQLEKELEKAVRSVFDDDEFVVGMRSICSEDKDRQALLNFIRKGKNVTTESVAVFAIKRKQARNSLD